MQVAGTAFASDFDGTLCHSDWKTGAEHFDPAVLDAVRRYQAAGGLFGICTGRPLPSVRESLKGILDLDFYIVTTGAQVLDKDLRPLLERTIERELAIELYERYTAFDEVITVVVSESGFLSVGRELSPGIRTVPSFDQVTGKLFGISFESHTNEPLAHQVSEDVNRRYAGRVEGFQNLGSVDVVAAGCSKGAGVQVVREALGVGCVAGAGDSYNDLPLLGAADVSYTFHSSPQEVRDAATCVVADLAEALEDFMAQ